MVLSRCPSILVLSYCLEQAFELCFEMMLCRKSVDHVLKMPENFSSASQMESGLCGNSQSELGSEIFGLSKVTEPHRV